MGNPRFGVFVFDNRHCTLVDLHKVSVPICEVDHFPTSVMECSDKFGVVALKSFVLYFIRRLIYLYLSFFSAKSVPRNKTKNVSVNHLRSATLTDSQISFNVRLLSMHAVTRNDMKIRCCLVLGLYVLRCFVIVVTIMLQFLVDSITL